MSDELKSVSRQFFAPSTANALLDLGFLPPEEVAGGRAAAALEAGDFIGRYRLVAPLGEGGFGLVWQAEQTEPIHRELALKVIKPGLDSREIIARFEAERQALALMDHPNISGVLDAGTSAEGRPYFAMELVKGEPITTFCDRHRLSIEDRLELFIPVCRAVQHAHQKSILHRDLKPSNILVATVDGKPVPKVIDFGIAKALAGNENPGLADQVDTQVGVSIGTPRYMSPEQAGSLPDVDTRSDIYSLGVVLCELLTGQSPYPAQPTEFLDALRWIRESEPVRPSTLAQSAKEATKEAAERRGTDSRRLTRKLKGDLDWITLKTLEKDRTLRYESAAALARDLERHLAEEPVSAVAPSWRYQLGKFARRQRGTLIAGSLVVMALIVGTVVSLWQASQARQSRAEAERRYTQARDAVDKFLVRVTDNPKLNETDFMDLRRELLETAMPFYEDLSRYRGQDPKLLGDRAWAIGNLADIAEHVGNLERAEAANRKSSEEHAELVVNFPEDDYQPLYLGRRLDRLAQVLLFRGKNEEAAAALDEAVKALEASKVRRPSNPDFQIGLAQMLNNRAVILDEMQRYDAAEKSRKMAIAIAEKLTSQGRSAAAYWGTLATTARGEASQLHREQRYTEEASKLRRAIECYETAIQAKPDWYTCRSLLAITRGDLGMALESANQLNDAVPILWKATAEFQSILAKFPSFKNCRENLVIYQKKLRSALLAQKKQAEAEAVLEQIRVNQERLARDFPQNAKYAKELAQTVASQNSQAGKGQDPATPTTVDSAAASASSPKAAAYAELIKNAQNLALLNSANWENLEAAAEGMAGEILRVRADDTLSEAARNSQVEAFADRAVKALNQAITKGYTGMAHFNTLPCAKALQHRAEYRALLVTPINPPTQGPKAFSFDYPFSDPGPRKWVREGLTWTETQPSGKKNVYTIVGRSTFNGMMGTKLERMGSLALKAFIPDVEPGVDHYLWILQKAGWVRFGPNTGVE